MKNGFALLAAFALFACDTDVTQDYTIPYTERLVLESFISPQDTLLVVRVMRTMPSIGKTTGAAGEATDASVELSNGTRTVTIPYSPVPIGQPYGGGGPLPVSGYVLKASEFPIEAGRTYTLRASVPSGLSAQAQCTVPARNLKQNEVEATLGKILVDRVYEYPTLQLRVKDAAGEVNRYAFTLFRTDTFKDNTGKVINQNRYATFSDYLTDTNRDGEWLSTPKNTLYQSQNSGSQFELYVATTDAAYYDYNTSIEKQRDAQGNPFAEPQPVYSNVQGGLGVFAAYQWVKVPVTL